MIKIGIYGATGYAGIELIRILLQHPEVVIDTRRMAWIPNKNEPEKLEDIFPHLQGRISVSPSEERDPEKFAKGLDVIFLAVPHEKAMEYVPGFLSAGAKVIDFSADYRIADVAVYEKWYAKHTSPGLLAAAVYGLPELYKDKIKKAQLIANPGCYPTVSILSVAPLIKEGLIDKNSIIIDAKSGVSGAGRSPAMITHYPECNEGIKAYAINSHRHKPEIEQELSKLAGNNICVSFVPHLTPMTRGILATVYANLKGSISRDELKKKYVSFYKGHPFVRISKKAPSTKQVRGSNYCDIDVYVDKDTNRVTVTSAIDNLIKGAAGQAVQNMNLICGLNESTGLDQIGVFP